MHTIDEFLMLFFALISCGDLKLYVNFDNVIGLMFKILIRGMMLFLILKYK